jgi:hypothetical protein
MTPISAAGGLNLRRIAKVSLFKIDHLSKGASTGRGFMSYASARARLRRAAAEVIASGGGRDLDLMVVRRVFE